MQNTITTLITAATNKTAAAFLVNVSQPGDLVSALPYNDALELARNIIANGGPAVGLNALKFMVKQDVFELLEFGDQYEVRVTYRNATVTTITRRYSDFIAALAELQRQYHEAIGWLNGLDPDFVCENDHQANGRRDRQENEIRLCADLDSTLLRF